MSQHGAVGGEKGGSKKGSVEGGVVCAHCKKVNGLGTMKCCSRCKRVNYCSVECQKLHWRVGGHKKVCGKERGSGARGDVAGASDAGDVSLQNPCPICLDNEDDAGKFGMCYSCGQMYCGRCQNSNGLLTTTSCPTCRAVLRVSKQEDVRRLWRLMERCGRFTPVVQSILGSRYDRGVGVAQDHTEAVRLFRLAADQGFANAQRGLGACYMKGTGVDKDFAEALRFFRLAAEQGDADAQFYLGVCYENGLVVDQDHYEAVRLYRLAADQGFGHAQLRLGYNYLDGTGVDKDFAEAMRLIRLAADQGNADAQSILARLELLSE
jgi:hypothetical protein